MNTQHSTGLLRTTAHEIDGEKQTKTKQKRNKTKTCFIVESPDKFWFGFEKKKLTRSYFMSCLKIAFPRFVWKVRQKCTFLVFCTDLLIKS